MGKASNVVDYRAVNLSWLIDFKERVLSKELAPEVELVLSQEDYASGSGFELRKGETLCVLSKTENTFILSKPYGEILQGEVPKTAVEPKPRKLWTTEDVAEYIVKRACMKTECIFLELMPKKSVSKREYRGTFVSQARRCVFTDLVDALEYYFKLKQANLSKEFVWLDIFSANQPKLTAKEVEASVRAENERQLTEGLHIAIANFDNRVMFMDKWDGATALTRAWCVWEIFGVAKAKKQLEIALSEREYDRFLVTLKEDYHSILVKTNAVDVEAAQCFNKADLETIHREIREKSSFEELNDIVKAQLRLWVASTGKLHVQNLEKQSNADPGEIIEVANNAGATYASFGDFANSLELLKKALVLAEQISSDPNSDKVLATQLGNLASVLQLQGSLLEAVPLYAEAVRIFGNAVGKDDIDYGKQLCNFGELLRKLGRLVEAERMLKEALKVITKSTGGNPDNFVATTLNNLGMVSVQQGKYEEGVALFMECLEMLKKLHGEEAPVIGATLNNIGDTLSFKGNFAAAETVHLKALAMRRKLLGNEHPDVHESLSNLARVLISQAKLKEAEPLLREALRIAERTFGKTHPSYILTLQDLAMLLIHMNTSSKEAVRLGKEALRGALKTFGKNHPTTQQLRKDWG